MSKLYLGVLAAITGAQLSIGAVAQETTPTPSTQTTDEITEFGSPAAQEYLIDKSTRMTVPVRINGSTPYPFVVDTGSERTVIAHDLAQLLALQAGRKLKLATIGGPEEVNSFLIDNLAMTTISVNDLEAPALDRNNLGAFGLLGIDSLEDHKVLLDFKAGNMDVLKSKKSKKKTELEDGMIVVTATRKAGRMILSSATIDGRKIDIILDTGAQTSMANTALRKRLRASNRSAFQTVVMHSVTGERVEGEYTQIRNIEISGLSINNLPVVLTDDNYAFDALGLKDRPAILLGIDALKLFDRVVIDFANRRVGFDLPREGRGGSSRYLLALGSAPLVAKP